MRVGIRVECNICHRMKQPRGRSVPVGMVYCNDDCMGYREQPLPGDLWPNETEEEFGYPVSDNGVTKHPDLRT